MSFHIVIPARYASVRLPAKPLAEIAGRPMILHVAQRAARSEAHSVVVATDDERIVAALSAADIDVMLTRADHESGSDRVMEVAQQRGWSDDSVVVNVQGDEPLIPVAVIEQVARRMRDEPRLDCATLCEPIDQVEQLFNPNVVKVVRTETGRALYFSRAPIPWRRSDFDGPVTRPLEPDQWHRHIGIYAYRIGALRRFVGLPRSSLEMLESLEQLRMLEHGMEIQVDIAVEPVPGGVDTAEDLDRVRALLG